MSEQKLLTMGVAELARIRLGSTFVGHYNEEQLLAELDAQMAAHAETREQLEQARELYLAANAIKATVKILKLTPSPLEMRRLFRAVEAIDAAMGALRAKQETEEKGPGVVK